MRDIFITGAACTPMGALQGIFAETTAATRGGTAIAAAMARSRRAAGQVQSL